MDQAEFQDWMSASDRPTSAQRAEAARVLSTDADEEKSVAAVERSVGESRICPRCARSLWPSHIALNHSAGPRIRGLCRIRAAGNRQSRFKGFLFRFRGISTKYLGNHLQDASSPASTGTQAHRPASEPPSIRHACDSRNELDNRHEMTNCTLFEAGRLHSRSLRPEGGKHEPNPMRIKSSQPDIGTG